MTGLDARVAITGLGVVTPIGDDLASFADALRDGRDGIRRVTRFSTTAYDRHLAGTFADSRWDDLARRVVSDPTAVDPVAVLGTLALREAVSDAGIAAIAPHRVALVVGSTAGGLSTRSAYEFTPVNRTEERATRFARTPMRAQTAHLARELGLRGPRITVSTACASSTHAIAHAFDLLRSRHADVVIAGGMDFLVEEMFCGFFAMESMSASPCAPFSEPRGMNVGEGAGFLVLERGADALERSAKIRAFVSGYGLSLDAYHAMSPDPTGSGGARALKSALDHAGCDPDRIGYVNAHGTGTDANDPAEWSSIQRALGPRAANVPVSSTKSYFGHALGAAGALEIAATIVCREDGTIPPTLHFTGSRGAVPRDPVGESQPRTHQWSHAAKMNSAFGGANAALVLESRDTPARITAAHRESSLVITGVGVVAAHGHTAFGEALARGIPLCTRDRRAEPIVPEAWSARVPDFEIEDIVRGIDARGIDLPARLLTLATHHALRDAKAKLTAAQRERLGLFVATAAPGWDTTGEFWGSIRSRGYPRVSTPAFSRVVINAAAGAASRMLGIRGSGSVFAGGIGSTLTALVCAGEHLRGHDDTEIVAVGGVYDLGAEVVVHDARGFPQTPSLDRPFPAYGTFDPCPFPGEGAVSLLVAREGTPPSAPLARILGVGLGAPGALDTALREALARAHLAADAVDVVFGSADGTVESGRRERDGCAAVFARSVHFANPSTVVGRTEIADGFALAAAVTALRTGTAFTVDRHRVAARTAVVIADDPDSGCIAVVLQSVSAEDSAHG